MNLTLRIKPDLSNLVEILDEYDQVFDKAEQDLEIAGKTLHDANKDQPNHMSFYGSKLVELKALQKFVDMHANSIRGTLWSEYKEKYSITLGTKDIDQYCNKEEKFININQLVILVHESVGHFEALLEAFRARGFALRNITEARIAEVSEFVL